MKSQSVLLSSIILQMKQTFSRNMYRFCLFVSPVIQTIILGEMYKNSGSENFTAYVVLGAGMMSLWGCIVFSSSGDINRERYSNTLSLIFATPSDFRLVLLGKIIGNTILSVFSFFITVLIAVVLYQKPIAIDSVGLFTLAFVLMIMCFVVISMFFAYLLTLSRKTTVYMNCLDIPFTLMFGFAFPVEILPNWATYICYLFPPTWATKLMRIAVLGGEDYIKTATILIISTTIFGVITQLLYKIIERQVKIDATLEVA